MTTNPNTPLPDPETSPAIEPTHEPPVLDLPLSEEDIEDIIGIGNGDSSIAPDALDTAIQYLQDL